MPGRDVAGSPSAALAGFGGATSTIVQSGGGGSQIFGGGGAVKPLAIDLYCGLGGWAEGFLAEGWRVKGFDIVRHDYGNGGYPGRLFLRDVTKLHGSQFKDAAVIVASPPCQKYSYMAMPWKRAKALVAWYAESLERIAELNRLFDACFRIQREASEAAGRYIPLIVENVRGAQRWVGRAKWHFGSYFLWGDVPALMPITRLEGLKVLERVNIRAGATHTRHLTNPREHIRIADLGVKLKSPGHYLKPGSGADWFDGGSASHGSNSVKRKAAAAEIAKIPFALAQHVAQTFKPVREECAA